MTRRRPDALLLIVLLAGGYLAYSAPRPASEGSPATRPPVDEVQNAASPVLLARTGAPTLFPESVGVPPETTTDHRAVVSGQTPSSAPSSSPQRSMRADRSVGGNAPKPSKGHMAPTAVGNGQSARYSPSSPIPPARITGAPLIALGQGALTTGHASMCDNSGVGVSDENPYHG